MVSLGVVLLVAFPGQADESLPGTAAQHHEWTRKFSQPDPTRTGSIPVTAGTSQPERPSCEPALADLIFATRSLKHWRPGSGC
jgi:hypothetical protein